MTACDWCGESHEIGRLCQRAQRGMSRRSFCFLFGAGIAAATLPVPAWVTTSTDVPADAYTTIQHSLSTPTTATSRTRDSSIRVGRTITVSLNTIGTVFNGTIDRIDIHADGSREVHAVDAVEFASRPSDYLQQLLGGA